jgi:perosamine synthetase
VTSPLALLGGTPAIASPTPHFTWPPLTDKTAESVLGQLATSISIYDRSGIVAALEDRLREYFGVKHAVLTSSGTAALHSMYAACRILPGAEIIVPAYTFFASVTPLLQLGAIPVLADCDANGNLDPRDVARRVTACTYAILVTHMWGTPADMDSLLTVAGKHELRLLEDASHAHGASMRGQKAGTFGVASAFSMNGPKPLSAGEGGFLLTDDDDVYYRTLLHGQYNKRCKNELPPAYHLARYADTGMGLKYRIHPLAAAIALDQLGHLDDYLTGRARIAAYMCEQLDGLPGIVVPRRGENVRSSWYGLILRYKADELEGLPIERLYDALKAEGAHEVDRPGSTCPLNLLPLFQEPGALFPRYEGRLNYAPGDFPCAEEIHRNTLT